MDTSKQSKRINPVVGSVVQNNQSGILSRQRRKYYTPSPTRFSSSAYPSESQEFELRETRRQGLFDESSSAASSPTRASTVHASISPPKQRLPFGSSAANAFPIESYWQSRNKDVQPVLELYPSHGKRSALSFLLRNQDSLPEAESSISQPFAKTDSSSNVIISRTPDIGIPVQKRVGTSKRTWKDFALVYAPEMLRERAVPSDWPMTKNESERYVRELAYHDNILPFGNFLPSAVARQITSSSILSYDDKFQESRDVPQKSFVNAVVQSNSIPPIQKSAKKKSSKKKKSMAEDPDQDASGENSRRLRRNWTQTEEVKFHEALELYGRDWHKCSEYVVTRDVVSCRSHAQKYFIKLWINGEPLPAKVSEGGAGYTVSGKPLDPTSSFVKYYMSLFKKRQTGKARGSIVDTEI